LSLLKDKGIQGMAEKTLLSWSTGKDSAWSLHRLLEDPRYDVLGLFCTINKTHSRTAMHGVRTELLKLQAERIGLPLEIIEIPYPCSNDDYERIMGDYVEKIREMAIDCFAFGDLFLEDIRDYRIEKLKGSGIEPIFPLWEIPTKQLATEMIAGGLRTVVVCIDPKQIPKAFVGREFNRSFLDDLPERVDPCGENGEFHSFVFDSPQFKKEINISVGEIVERDGFVYADVIPEGDTLSGDSVM